jgi:hypothetical protein
VRALLIALALAALGGCTVANPDYCDSSSTCPNGGVCDRVSNRCLTDTTGCAGRPDGLRACSGDRTQSGTCAAAQLVADRACPADAPCHYGWCTPGGEKPCVRDADCGADRACAIFRDVSGATRLLCADVSGAGGPGATCADETPAAACRSGLCAGGRCLAVCETNKDCGPGTCEALAVTVEEASMTVRTCVP